MKPTKPTTLPLIALAALATAGAAQDHAAFAPPQAPSYAAYDACAGLCKTTYVHCGAALHFATTQSTLAHRYFPDPYQSCWRAHGVCAAACALVFTAPPGTQAQAPEAPRP